MKRIFLILFSILFLIPFFYSQEVNSQETISQIEINGISSKVLLASFLILVSLSIFIFIIKWILSSITKNIKEDFENLKDQINNDYSNLKENLIEAIKNLQNNNCHSIDTLNDTINNILHHIVDIKKESGNFILNNKSAKILITSFLELQSYKETQIIIDVLINKTITKLDEAISYCKLKFIKIIEDDIDILYKIDFTNGNLGEVMKELITEESYNTYINVIVREMIILCWDENDFEKVRQNTYFKLFLYKQNYILKETNMILFDTE